jgi:hypothetical protein
MCTGRSNLHAHPKMARRLLSGRAQVTLALPFDPCPETAMPRAPAPDFPDLDDTGRPDLGPSDSSDSASDLPPGMAHSDSDSQATGERESVEPDSRDDDGSDIAPDRVTGGDEAGLSHSAPNPERNGG